MGRNDKGLLYDSMNMVMLESKCILMLCKQWYVFLMIPGTMNPPCPQSFWYLDQNLFQKFKTFTLSTPWWVIADGEIKIPSAESSELWQDLSLMPVVSQTIASHAHLLPGILIFATPFIQIFSFLLSKAFWTYSRMHHNSEFDFCLW